MFELLAVVVIPQPMVARLQLHTVLVKVLHPIVRLPGAPVREALGANYTPCLGPRPLPLLEEVTTPNPEPGRVKVRCLIWRTRSKIIRHLVLKIIIYFLLLVKYYTEVCVPYRSVMISIIMGRETIYPPPPKEILLTFCACYVDISCSKY